MAVRDKFHYWKPARGMPYEDVENLRPETKKIVETWLKIYGDPTETGALTSMKALQTYCLQCLMCQQE